jgi:hypothetical protein
VTLTTVLQEKMVGRARFERATNWLKACLCNRWWAAGQDLSNPPLGRKYRTEPNRKATFGDLISTYLEWQRVTGKKSAKTIGNVIKNHIRGKATANELWLSNLSDIDSETISDFLSHLRDSTTPHIADHARQIIKAAYNKASNSFAEEIELKEQWKALGSPHTN